jgi:putative sterol carrier protein
MAAALQGLVEALAARSLEHPLPAAVDGVIRLDAESAGRIERWYVLVDKGVVKVARRGGRPDCILRGDVATFTAVLSGEANLMAALLRGALEFEGAALLLLVLQRLSPGETVSAAAPTAGYARRQG